MKYGVEIVIAAIVIMLIALAAGYITRKKYYKEIDRLESRKLDLMHRPVAEELAKVKKLNMTGQTEEMFERWRQTWDDIITTDLPNIDERLFDGEEYTDKYRFKKAKQTFYKIEASLEHIEGQIAKILGELSELIGSEEQNRTDIESLAEKFKLAKKNLLAHRHSYGIAADKLESLLDDAGMKMAEYEAMTEEGNYLEARQVVLDLKAGIEELEAKMAAVPDLLVECNAGIPSQKSELQEGFAEMIKEGYVLGHLQVEKQLDEMDEGLAVLLQFIQHAEVESASAAAEEIKEKIDSLYDLLEKEVYARHYLLQENEKTGFILGELMGVSGEMLQETEMIQHTYELPAEEIEEPKAIEKSLSQLLKRHELLTLKIEEEQSAYSMLSEELQYIESQLKELQEKQSEYSNRLQNLRKDELEARDLVAALQRKIKAVIREVKRSRMPGLPSGFESLFEMAEEQIGKVNGSLQAKPLNMGTVKGLLNDAQDSVDHLYDKTIEYIEDARFAELVIQYGNRYRGKNPELRQSLEQAEQSFRNCEYKLALEQAGTAVEKVEPGAIKKIEDFIQEEVHI